METENTAPRASLWPPREQQLFQRVIDARNKQEARQLYLRQQSELIELRRRQMQAERRLRGQLHAVTGLLLLTMLLVAGILLGAPQ